jgi:hypothetical protein
MSSIRLGKRNTLGFGMFYSLFLRSTALVVAIFCEHCVCRHYIHNIPKPNDNGDRWILVIEIRFREPFKHSFSHLLVEKL